MQVFSPAAMQRYASKAFTYPRCRVHRASRPPSFPAYLSPTSSSQPLFLFFHKWFPSLFPMPRRCRFFPPPFTSFVPLFTGHYPVDFHLLSDFLSSSSFPLVPAFPPLGAPFPRNLLPPLTSATSPGKLIVPLSSLKPRHPRGQLTHSYRIRIPTKIVFFSLVFMYQPSILLSNLTLRFPPSAVSLRWPSFVFNN